MPPLHQIFKNRHRLLIVGLLCLLFVTQAGFAFFQQTPQSTPPANTRTQPTTIFLEAADSAVIYNNGLQKGVRVLYGNVIFRHDGTFMYCDSAYLYSEENNMEAFSNVRMEQGDSLFVYGDYLHYTGNLALARLRDNVRMEQDSVTLFTDSLNYDRNKNIGYYFEGGMIVDPTNELSSTYGQYSPDTKIAFFKDLVTLNNPQFVLTSDTLKYSTETRIATIVGPSVITSENGVIHSSRGWYNTVSEDSKLYDRSVVWNQDGSQSLTGDSIYYNRMSDFGEAFGNMFLNDTVKKVILTGNYGYFDNLNENAMATDSAQFIEYSQGDSLFLHADSLKMITIAENDQEIRAYYGVRFFRTDIQGVCDSMHFNRRDSILRMYKDPILWNTNYQISGDTINLFFNDSTIREAQIYPYAFATEKVGETYYNQMKGKELVANFNEGELSLVYVSGNAETIFYPIEEGGEFIGLNQTESSYFRIHIKDRKPVRMTFWPEPKGRTMPIPDLTPENKFLKDFQDHNYLRPMKKEDIFLRVKREISEKEGDRPRRRR